MSDEVAVGEVGGWAEAALLLAGAGDADKDELEAGDTKEEKKEDSGSPGRDAPLVQKVQFQLRHYFSPANLQNDRWLKGRLDDRMRLPVSVLTEFKRIKEMGASQEVVEEAVRGMEELEVIDGTQAGAGGLVSVKGLRPPQRTTVVLRDVPEDVPEEEVKGVFSIPPKEVRREIAQTVFCTFDTEEDCLTAFLSLPSATLRGQPVRGRIKSETANVDVLTARYAAEHGVRPDPLAQPWYPPGHPDAEPPIGVSRVPTVPPWAQPSGQVAPWAMPPPHPAYGDFYSAGYQYGYDPLPPPHVHLPGKGRKGSYGGFGKGAGRGGKGVDGGRAAGPKAWTVAEQRGQRRGRWQ
eukprot:Hpha_TRINITY_DN16279_c6_g3::TRINITY_DN16279_c6_g3_i1::g.11889::m.11889/K18763/LARP4; la-related protein 4